MPTPDDYDEEEMAVLRRFKIYLVRECHWGWEDFDDMTFQDIESEYFFFGGKEFRPAEPRPIKDTLEELVDRLRDGRSAE